MALATRTISTLLKLDGEAEYKAQITNINRELAIHKAELQAVEEAYRGSANSMEALSAKGDVLQKQYDALRQKLDIRKEGLNEAVQAEAKYSAEIEKQKEAIAQTEKELADLQSSTEDTSEAEAELTERLKEQRAALSQSEELQARAANTVQQYQKETLQAETALSKMGNAVKENNQYLNEARTSADGTATSIDEMGKKTQASTESINALGGALAAGGIAAGLKALVGALNEAVAASVEFESAVTGVYKTVDGTAEQLAAISDGIKQLSTVIPASTTELAAVAEAAGQLGIATNDVLGFTEVMINLGVTTNLSAEQAAASLAKFTNITGTSADDYERLGSTIVALGNNFATTEADIVTMSTRLASAGTLAGLMESEIMALATAMSSVGIQAEAGGTAMTQTFSAIEKATAKGGETLEQFAKIAGVSANEFTAMWRNDALSAVSAFIDGLGGLEAQGENATLVLDEMGLSGIRQGNMLKSLALASDTLTEAISLSSVAWEENTALAAEAALRYGTTESKFQLLENSTLLLKQAIGDALTPALGSMAEAGAEAAQWAADFAAENPEVVGAVTGVIVAIGALTVAITAYTAASMAATAVSKALGVSVATLGATLGPVVALVAGIGLVVGVLAASVGDANTALTDLQEQTRSSTTAYDDAKAAILSQSESVSSLALQLDYLSQTSDGSTGSMQAMKDVTSQLTALIPELTGYIDEETGALADGWQAVVELTQAQEEHALAKQREAIISAELTTAERGLAEARAEMQALEEKGISNKAIDILLHEGLVDLLSDEQLRYIELQQELGGYSAQVETSAEALAAAKTETEAFAEANDTGAESVANLTGELQSILGEMDSLTAAYDKSYEAAYKSIDSQIGLFETMSVKVNTSAGDMISSLDSQIAYMDTYAENMARAAEMGVDEGLLAKLSDGSVESAEYLQAIVDGGEEKVGELNEKFAQVEEGKQAFAEQIAEMETGFSEKMEDLQAKLDETVSELNKTPEAAQAGLDTVQGYLNGLDSKSGALYAKMQSMALQAIASFKQGLESASPSKAMMREADNTADGYIIQMESRQKDVDRVMKDAGSSAVKAYAEGMGSQKNATATAMQEAAEVAFNEAWDKYKDYANLKKALDQARKMDVVNDREYYDKLLELRDRYLSPGSDDYIGITEDIYKYETRESEAARANAIDAYEEYVKAYVDATNAALDEVQKRFNDVAAHQEAMAQKLIGYGELVDRVKISWNDGSTTEYSELSDIQSQIDVMREYEQMLSTLRDRGATDTMMAEVLSMDVDSAIEYGNLLLQQTDKQWDEYVRLWEEKQQIAKDIAEQFYKDELDALENEYNALLQESLGVLNDTAFRSGESTVESIIAGMRAKEAALEAQVSRIAAIMGGASGAGVDGSHAGGLRFVPYDGYVAELHAGERVLTAEEARAYVANAMPTVFDAPMPPNNSAAMNAQTAEIINALGTLAMGAGSSGSGDLIIIQQTNGVEFHRATIQDFRQVESENPVEINDF